jgi:hypothetical protein
VAWCFDYATRGGNSRWLRRRGKSRSSSKPAYMGIFLRGLGRQGDANCGAHGSPCVQMRVTLIKFRRESSSYSSHRNLRDCPENCGSWDTGVRVGVSVLRSFTTSCLGLGCFCTRLTACFLPSPAKSKGQTTPPHRALHVSASWHCEKDWLVPSSCLEHNKDAIEEVPTVEFCSLCFFSLFFVARYLSRSL